MQTTHDVSLKLEPLLQVVESLRRGEADERLIARVVELVGEVNRSKDRELQEASLQLIQEAQDAALAWIREVSSRLDEFARQFQMKKAYEAFGRAIE
jgi:dsDNA-specific endonuclease/ATPase MutS2